MKAYLVVCTERDYDEDFASQIIAIYLSADKARRHLEEIIRQFRDYDEAHLAYCTEVAEIARRWLDQSGISDKDFTFEEVKRFYGVFGLIAQIQSWNSSQISYLDADSMIKDINSIIYTMKLKSIAPTFPTKPDYVDLPGGHDDYRVIEVTLDTEV